MAETANLTGNVWYQYFTADSSRDWILILMYGGRALWALLALLFNIGVVYVTIRNKNLHHVCNVLIALESFFAIFQDTNFFVSFVVVASGLKFIRYSACFPILVPLALGGESSQITMLCTGCDRLLAVLFPIWYQFRNPRKYLLFFGMIIFLYTCYMAILYYLDLNGNQDLLLSCSVHELPSGLGSTVRRINSIVISVLLMIVYFLVWYLVFCKKDPSKSLHKNNRRLIKSLCVIIGFNLVGVLFKNIAQLLVVNLDVFVKTGITFFFYMLTIAVYGANAPVLYFMSSEYRSAFNKHFKFIKCITFNKCPSATASTQVVIVTINGHAQSQFVQTNRGREASQIRQQSTIRGAGAPIPMEGNM